MSDNQDNENYLAQLKNRTVEMPLSQAMQAITDAYLRQEAKVIKLNQHQARLANQFKTGEGDDAPVSQEQIAEEDRVAAMKELDSHYAKNRKDIEDMRKTAEEFRAKAAKSGGLMKKYFNTRAHLFDARATNAEQLLDRMMDPMSETRQKATEYRTILAEQKAKAEEAKDKMERETDPQEKRRLAKEAFRAGMNAARLQRDLDKLETADRQLGLDKISDKTQNAVQNRQRDRKQAAITTSNIERDLADETPKLKKLEALLGDVFALERQGVETIDVRMLSKRDFAHLAEAVAEAAAALPADILPSNDELPVKQQLEIMNRQYDFARQHARGLLSDFLWQFDETVKKLDADAAGRQILSEVMPPMKKDQIASDTQKVYGEKAKQATQAKRRVPAPKTPA